MSSLPPALKSAPRVVGRGFGLSPTTYANACHTVAMPDEYAPWDIYAGQMAKSRFGVALWSPSPTNSYVMMRRGLVGYIIRGRFELLFDANGPLGDRLPGRDVPIDFVPLPEVTHSCRTEVRPPQRLIIDTKRDFGLSAHAGSQLLPLGAVFEYNSTSSKGAVLLTRHHVLSEDATAQLAYSRYMKENYKSWLQFAESQDRDVGLGDLILVTGHDITRDYAMAAFANNNTAIRISFEAGSPALGAGSSSISAWGSWQTSPFVHQNCGPLGPRNRRNARSSTCETSSADSYEAEPLLEGASEVEAEFDQCIFVRGYRMRERKLLAPSVIQAAALGHDHHRRLDDEEPPAPSLTTDDDTNSEVAPRSYPSGLDCGNGKPSVDTDAEDEEGASDTVSVYTDTPPFVDPAERVFEYLFENSGADVAIVHDEDLARFMEEESNRSGLLPVPGLSVRIDAHGVAQLASNNLPQPSPTSFVAACGVPLEGIFASQMLGETGTLSAGAQYDIANSDAQDSPWSSSRLVVTPASSNAMNDTEGRAGGDATFARRNGFPRWSSTALQDWGKIFTQRHGLWRIVAISIGLFFAFALTYSVCCCGTQMRKHFWLARSTATANATLGYELETEEGSFSLGTPAAALVVRSTGTTHVVEPASPPMDNTLLWLAARFIAMSIISAFLSMIMKCWVHSYSSDRRPPSPEPFPGMRRERHPTVVMFLRILTFLLEVSFVLAFSASSYLAWSHLDGGIFLAAAFVVLCACVAIAVWLSVAVITIHLQSSSYRLVHLIWPCGTWSFLPCNPYRALRISPSPSLSPSPSASTIGHRSWLYDDIESRSLGFSLRDHLSTPQDENPILQKGEVASLKCSRSARSAHVAGTRVIAAPEASRFSRGRISDTRGVRTDDQSMSGLPRRLHGHASQAPRQDQSRTGQPPEEAMEDAPMPHRFETLLEEQDAHTGDGEIVT